MIDEKEVAEIQSLLVRCSSAMDKRFVQSYQILKEVLTRICWHALDEKMDGAFTLTEQLSFLYNQYHISLTLQKGIHQFRLTCFSVLNKENEVTEGERELLLSRDVEVLTELFSLVILHLESSEENDGGLTNRATDIPSKIRRLRVVFHAKDEEYLYVEPVDYVCSELQQVRIKDLDSFAESLDLLWKGVQLNLLWVTIDVETGHLLPELIVVEPDYLIDISTLAECYRPYGAHPFNYILSKLTPISNALPILLGNIVNLFLDEWVYSEDKPDYIDCMMKAFRMYPLELAACKDLKNPAKEREFAQNCKMHFEHIGYLLQNEFSDDAYRLDRNDAVLEPSYICESLGLQGRLDYMQRDHSALIEMKSGRADEFTLRNKGEILPYENHRIQMLLYLAVLQLLKVDGEATQAYLLYTKYPKLYPSSPSWGAIKSAINLRNQIVAYEHSIHRENEVEFTQNVFKEIQPTTLCTLQVNEKFWKQYLLPPIEAFTKNIEQLSVLEKAYFYRLYNFITKELYLSKSGELNYSRFYGAASLWLSPFMEKVDRGEILYDLKILSNHAAEARKAFVELARPQKEKKEPESLPNFRLGDAVVLYERNNAKDNATNQRVFKGNICLLTTTTITIRLRASQKNEAILPSDSLYAVEHDTMDVGFRNMFQGLHYFLTGSPSRRNLLLGQRPPRFDSSYAERIRNAADDFERLALKALAAEDYFLVVGPPGTGKTSRALRRMVERFYEKETNQILLMAYTNRAVDEICKALDSIDPSIHYIRIGSELSCHEDYRDQLIENQLEGCKNRKQVSSIIQKCRVYVGTVSSLVGKSDLFELKQFDVAIIDEASQILEAQLLGVLMACNEKGESAIRKFVMIGDHKQLPAIVLQSAEDAEVKEEELLGVGIRDLRESLFERLYANAPLEAVDLLRKQGRMHPEIADFPNRSFYDGKLESLGLPHQVNSLSLPLNGCCSFLRERAVFIPSQVEEEALSSKVNFSEAQIVSRLVYDLYRYSSSGFNPHQTLGVITPFRSQIALIKNAIAQLGIDDLNAILIDTVERFQGSERDIIIYSFCVNNVFQLNMLPNMMQEGDVFVDRKLNVALTRARKQLFITGVEPLLRQNKIYARLIDSMFYFQDRE